MPLIKLAQGRVISWFLWFTVDSSTKGFTHGTIQIVNVSFDCSLDDDNWTEKDRIATETKLAESYVGEIIEV